MSVSTAAYLTLLAPLAGGLLITVLGMRLAPRTAGWVACAAVLAGFVGAIGALLQFEGDHGVLLSPYQWLTVGTFDIGFDLYVDPLSIFEMLVVTGVGFLIHVYSLGYMAGDPQFRRFFAYMNIFVFAMLMLVMAGNFVLLLVGWGLVGLASYLLIGFWHDRPTAVAAAKKAFIVNAIGDVSLMLAIFLIFREVGVLDYPRVFEALPGAVGSGSGTAAAICLLLLGGALAKSAQLPLHTWLPDAMEGPTPVSALIHAATMVTAGVYLIARMWPVFDLSEGAQMTVALIGAVTLVVAGFVALAQTDIKRVIAYSTMSQIGYMFVAVGVGAYSAGMFHLMTHAFFKALLFLAAGIVIHALADEQDIRRMGGLRRLMPKTYGMFLVGSLALAGIIPLSGFFSKDEILAFAAASGDSAAFGGVGFVVYGLSMLGVLLTGLYTFRLFFLVFHGSEGEATQVLAAGTHGHVDSQHASAHASHGEGPATMLVPVMVLTVLAAVGGWLVIPGLWNSVGDYLHMAHAAPTRASLGAVEFDAGKLWVLALCVSLPIAVVGAFFAYLVWNTGSWAALRQRFPGAERVFQRAFGFDALYDRLFYRPAAAAGRAACAVEEQVVGPSMGIVAEVAHESATLVSRLQNGLVRSYALGTAVGVVLVVGTFLWVQN